MGIIGNIAKNTAKEYAELLCKGIAGIGLMGFSYVTYNTITGSRKLAKKAITASCEAIEKIPTPEERKALREQKAKEEKARKLEETYADMKRRQKESMERGGR